MTQQGVSLGTPVVHRCELSHLMFDAPVTHVVLPARRPCSTPLSDIRAAGFDVLATGLFPGEIDGCDDAGAYGNSQHLLVRPSKDG
jgi:hypothetical protein